MPSAVLLSSSRRNQNTANIHSTTIRASHTNNTSRSRNSIVTLETQSSSGSSWIDSTNVNATAETTTNGATAGTTANTTGSNISSSRVHAQSRARRHPRTDALVVLNEKNKNTSTVNIHGESSSNSSSRKLDPNEATTATAKTVVYGTNRNITNSPPSLSSYRSNAGKTNDTRNNAMSGLEAAPSPIPVRTTTTTASSPSSSTATSTQHASLIRRNRLVQRQTNHTNNSTNGTIDSVVPSTTTTTTTTPLMRAALHSKLHQQQLRQHQQSPTRNDVNNKNKSNNSPLHPLRHGTARNSLASRSSASPSTSPLQQQKQNSPIPGSNKTTPTASSSSSPIYNRNLNTITARGRGHPNNNTASSSSSLLLPALSSSSSAAAPVLSKATAKADLFQKRQQMNNNNNCDIHSSTSTSNSAAAKNLLYHHRALAGSRAAASSKPMASDEEESATSPVWGVGKKVSGTSSNHGTNSNTTNNCGAHHGVDHERRYAVAASLSMTPERYSSTTRRRQFCDDASTTKSVRSEPRPQRSIAAPSTASATGIPAVPPDSMIKQQHQHQLRLKHQAKVHRQKRSPRHGAAYQSTETSVAPSTLPLHLHQERNHSPVRPLPQQQYQRQPPNVMLSSNPSSSKSIQPPSTPPYQRSPGRPYDRYQQQPHLQLKSPNNHYHNNNMSSSGRLSSPSRRSATTPNRNYNRTDDDNNSNIDEGGSLIRGYRQPNMNDNNSNTTPMTMNRYQNRQHHQVHSPSLESWRQDQSQEGAFQSRTHPLQNFNHDADEKKSNRSPRMEEKGRHNQNLQQFQQTSSSMSDYETDASRDRDRNYYASYSTHQDQGDYDHHNRLHGGDFKNSSRHQSYTTKYNSLQNEPTFSNMSASQMTPDVAGFFDQTTVASAVSAPRSAKDDDTYDYGDRDEVINDALDEEEDDDDEDDDEDDASQGSLSYEQRKQKMEREREARDAAVAAAKAELDGPFMQQDDVEHYRKAVDTPLGRTAAGVAVAASFGCILLGPVGLLVGAAAVGIGAGYMQIPEEQRQNMSKKATEAVKNAHDSAYVCSEKISNSCALSYRDSGMADHVPVEIETCCTTLAGLDENGMTSADHDESVMESVMDTDAPEATDIDGKEIAGASKGGHDKRKGGTPTHRASWLRDKKGKAVCHRKGKAIPIAQIHALDPAAQPKAWLEVLASAETSIDDRIEATEEVLILAKDKQKCRIFVDEGILDCLLWTTGRFLEKKAQGPGSEHWANPTISQPEAIAAKLSASCCLTLGKSYCAAVHTEGDLLLMSLYDRGTVPEERQLAQMLLEVPHHERSAKAGAADDPTVLTPGKEVFVLKQMTLPQAEELAATIAALANNNPLPQTWGG